MPSLEERWMRFCERTGALAIEPSVSFGYIRYLYVIPRRVYHNLEGHIARGLGLLEMCGEVIGNPDCVEFAYWMHDGIYDPYRDDNEEQSAESARTFAINIGLPRGFADHSAVLIMGTQHEDAPSNSDMKLLADVDLSILGTPDEEFDVYERHIREEYSRYSDMAFTRGRTAILQRFQERERIYSTDYFYARYEQKARENIERSLTALREVIRRETGNT